MEEPAGSTQPAPLSHRRSREMEDIDVRRIQKSPLAQRTTRSLRRRPRGPAPDPPATGMREHRAATLNRQALETAREKKVGEIPSEKKESETTGVARKPARKAPVRPAPTRRDGKTTPTAKAVEKTTPPREVEDTQQQQLEREKEIPKMEEKSESVEKEEEEEEEAVDFTGYEFHAITPPKVQSPTPQTPPTTPPNSSPDTTAVVTATVVPQEGGGKTLIIKPSPSSSRKANIIFNLPPPPPPPEFGGPDSQTQDNGVNQDTSVAMVTESQPANEMSVISNEYTNLDEDSDEEEEEEKLQLASVQEEAGTGGTPAEDGGQRERVEEEKKEGGDEPSNQQNGVAVEEESKREGEGGKTVTLTLNKDVAALNCNGNNNSYPPPPLEFVAPAEKFSTPAPLEGFTMPAEPSFDEDSEESSDDQDDAVVLVAMTTHRDKIQTLSVEGEQVAEEEEETREDEEETRERGMKGCDSTSSVKSLGTQLSIIDSLVSSIQDMTEEMIAEPEIPPPPPPPPTPPPVHPPVKKSPLPPKPAPPPTVSSVRKPANSVSSPKVTRVTPVHQPETVLSSRKPANFISAPISTAPALPVTPETGLPVTPEAVSGDVAELRPALSDSQTANLRQPLPVTPVSGPQSILQSGNLAAGDVGLQLQLLQQQVLQQQMMQLQQQFQQLQQSLQHSATNPAAAMAMIPPTMYPHPALVAMTMGGMPGMGQPVAMPTSGMVPMGAMMGQFSPSHSAPLTSTPTSQQKPHPPNEVISEGKPHPPDGGGGQQETDGGCDVTAQLRSGALGSLEPQFDRLMEDVREVEQSAILKKVASTCSVSVCVPTNPLPLSQVSVEPAEDDGSGSYSGMAAVLAEALRERRKHLTTDKREILAVVPLRSLTVDLCRQPNLLLFG